MRPLYKKYWIILLFLNITFLFSSCEKFHQLFNDDPYSDSKNDDYSLIGFYWDGVKYVQSSNTLLLGKDTRVSWDIVKIDEKEYIIVYSGVGGGIDMPMHIYELWLIFPYQDVILGKEYTADIYPSAIHGGAPYNIFLVNGKESNDFRIPITASVKYSKKGKNIQGSFTATGTMEMVDGSIKDIVLENGTFNLSYSSNYIKAWSVEKWFSGTYLDGVK